MSILLLGAVGEIIIEKTGHLNLGIPGTMCVGGLFGCIGLNAVNTEGTPAFVFILVGILFAFIGASLMGVIYSFLTVTLRSNQNITGLILTTLGTGISVFFMKYLDPSDLENAFLSYRVSIPSFDGGNPTNFENGIIIILAIVIAIVATLVFKYTRVGLHLRAVGESPATADAAGINVSAYKYWGTVIGSGIAGIGGFSFMVNRGFTISDVTPYGWLAVALVIFVTWKPALAILGATIFAFLLIFADSGLVVGIGAFYGLKKVIEMLPYVITIVILVLTSMRKKKENMPPASLGLNYFREER